MKSNLTIVLDFLKWGPRECTVKFPDGQRYGWDGENLCIILNIMDYNDKGEFVATDEIWTVTDLPLNYINQQCESLSTGDIMDIVFVKGRRKVR